jgi:hypothetical protein
MGWGWCRHAVQLSENVTESALGAFTDFALGSRCELLVLNMESFFSAYLLQSACFKYGKCPAFRNMGGNSFFG